MSSSPPEPGLLALWFARWNRVLPSAGALAFAALGLAISTGIALAPGYDAASAADSVRALVLTSPSGRLLRALHAWSSHLLLLFSLLHAVEHLAAGSERRTPRGVWLRVVAAVPLLLGLALGGFLLKADAEGELARAISAGLLERVPLIGGALRAGLLGREGELRLVYLHHAATLTLAVLLVTIEHARRVWPEARAVALAAVAALLAAVLLPPALHDGAADAATGPWFLVGMQELLRWLPRPGWSWPLLLAPLVLLAWLPQLSAAPRRHALGGLAVAILGYFAVSILAGLFRGPGGELTLPLPAQRPASRAASPLLAPLTLARLDPAALPEVLGRREGCLGCHREVGGLGASHDPASIGCASCHLGDASAADAAGAHAGMVRVPGNLDSVALTCGRCHDALAGRVRGSPMATLRGMISVDRWAFGEQAGPDALGGAAAARGVASLADSTADTHLRQLCVGCHLGTLKEVSGPPGERSRGGGCAACHAAYPGQRDYSPERAASFTHPAVSVQVGDQSCFGCHSRSGRISLGYSGWREAGLTDAEAAALPAGSARRLEDGRWLQRQPDDVHHAAGMACIDCHTAQELMGDGERHLHQESATRVRCETCHRTRPASSRPRATLDAEAAAIVRLRPGAGALDRFLLEDRTGEALTNARPLEGGTVELRGKLSGAKLLARPPAPGCAQPGHERLSCRACHETRVTSCVGCHTQWDAAGRRRDHLSGDERAGAWVEYDAAPRSAPPTLGLLARDGREEIVPFAPGMISTLNPPALATPTKLPASAAALLGPQTLWLRAFAPVVPHTTQRRGLACADCHLDPEVLGYGRGRLSLTEERGALRWRFEPEAAAAPQDGLPADAWIGLLDGRGGVSTRTAARALSPEEQRRTLEVGACLGCHEPGSAAGRELYAHFRQRRPRAGPMCRVPAAP